MLWLLGDMSFTGCGFVMLQKVTMSALAQKICSAKQSLQSATLSFPVSGRESAFSVKKVGMAQDMKLLLLPSVDHRT